MTRFTTRLIMSPVAGERLWILEVPLVYKSLVLGRWLTVPAGFVFDGNSVPRATWCVNVPTDFIEAGCVHDFLYRFGHSMSITRQQADAVYREALRVLGMGKLPAQVRYLALRAFGARAYMKPQSI